MFGWEFPPFNSGGLGVACRGLVSHFPDSIETLLVLPKAPKKSDSDQLEFLNINQSKNLKVEKINSPMEGYITSSEYKKKIQRRDGVEELSMYGNDLFKEVERYAQKAGSLAKHEDFDVIHAHDWLTFGAGINAKKKTGKPMIAHIHATEFDRTAGHGTNEFVFDRERSGMEVADKVVTVSRRTKNIISGKYKIDSSKIEVAYNGIDESRFEPEKGEPLKIEDKDVILFLGRITMQKHPNGFLHAAKKVLEEKEDVLFIMAGSGDMQREVMRKAAQHGIADKVLFPGYVSGKKLSGLYKSADLFVMPSVSEPFGLTALEAMVHETPVLISKQSGVSEVLNHALKTDFWDIDDIASKIISVLNHDALKNILRKKTQEETSKHSWHRTSHKCHQVYQEILT
jgi:glycosyltransferase involved in cell wall biosynthesis